MSTFFQPSHWMASQPAVATPAPVRPATRPWLSLVGRPYHQAAVLQMTMPIMAAPTVWMSTRLASMMPLPMVEATSRPAKAPAALRVAAIRTAVPGRMTRVETTVAMALGASVQPLTNSAARIRSSQGAMRIRASMSGIRSGVLHDDVAEDVGVVLALVAGVLESLVHLLPFHDVDGVAPVLLEEIRDDGVVEAVRLVLQLREAHDAFVDLVGVGEVPEQGGAAVVVLHHPNQGLRELLQGLGRIAQLQEDEVLARPFQVVEDVVEVDGDGADVVGVEGGDEARVEGIEHFLGDHVALVL